MKKSRKSKVGVNLSGSRRRLFFEENGDPCQWRPRTRVKGNDKAKRNKKACRGPMKED